jgi:anti-anti-sigma factor
MFDLIIRPQSDLVDFQSWDEFAETVTRLVEMNVKELVLDLGHVNRMSSNYIGTIISAYRAAAEKGNLVRLVQVRPKLYDLFQMLKLTDVMTIERAPEA